MTTNILANLLLKNMNKIKYLFYEYLKFDILKLGYEGESFHYTNKYY